MLKYLLGFALVFGLAVYVAIQDESTTQQAAQEAQQSSKPLSAVDNPNHHHKNVPNAKGNLPSWYGFFRWPNGTTTWAILLTLLAIAEQTHEMRRSVLINLRPRVLIRGIEVPPPDPTDPDIDFIPRRDIQIELANAGGSDARIIGGNITFARETAFSNGAQIALPAFPPYDPKSPKFEPFTLRAGEYSRRALQLDDNMSFTLMLRDGGRANSSTVRTANMFCFGFVTYRDKLGIDRRTGFAFRYNMGENDFRRVDNADYTYSD